MTQEKLTDEEIKVVRVRLREDLLNILQGKAQELGLSMNGYLNLVLNSVAQKEDIPFKETVVKGDKKEIESRVYFTLSEADLLRAYALSNSWSLSKEIRYRTISSLSQEPKLSGEELKAIYAVQSSINVLGANLNRLIRNSTSLSDDNIVVCQELVSLMKELRDKINYLEKCSTSRFKLKEGGADGR